ncbi:MAG: hypothetical protein LAP13_07135 [Acidobacteriia bacterium]|nr:hypothetical protein [Terriglobia bacterium]
MSNKKPRVARREFLLASVAGVAQAVALAKPRPEMIIALSRDASPLEALAAGEICRYLYLRTGQLLRIASVTSLPRDFRGFAVSEKCRPWLAGAIEDPDLRKAIDTLQGQQFLLRKVTGNGREFMLITGGDPVGTLYGAYRLAEHYDVRFYLHGDVSPDRQVPLALPDVDEIRRPLFELRGVNPWGSHSEGCDLWNTDDYKALIAQLAKMRMNFIGMHGYPEAPPSRTYYGAEPTVWVGLPGDFDAEGRVTYSYPSSYFNTLREGWWGYLKAKRTSDYRYGAALLFERDDWGSDVMRGDCPLPATPQACNEVFNRTAVMFRSAFRFARFLEVKTAIGTETPLVIPGRIQEQLRAQGKNPADPRVVQEVYAGTFQRIMKAHPLDLYWFWTSEDWTWMGVSDRAIQVAVDDIKLGAAAAKDLGAPFQLATAGWVLGPAQDPALFGKVLPKEIAVSEMTRATGKWPVDRAFAQISGRSKWAIPWLEDDPALTSPQLWVGRVRKDASDALAYGCNGLMGVHWRTRIMGPNSAALAQAAWDQSGWVLPPAPTEPIEGPVGGQKLPVATSETANTEEQAVDETYRLGMASYRLKIPNGKYRVTLRFFEPDYDKPGDRVFDVKIQDVMQIEGLDLVARAGKRTAHREVVDPVTVSDGWLVIEFVPHAALPIISAIVIENVGYAQKINCGGSAFQDYAADWPEASETPDRFLAAGDFYDDWARIEFGPEVASRAAAIFKSLDCHLPIRSTWLGGAGDIAPEDRPWQVVDAEYGFVDRLERLRPEVAGPGNQERFEYWLNTFHYMRATAHVRCLLADFNLAMKRAKAEQDKAAQANLADQEALPAYQRLLAGVGEACRYLLLTVSTNGELGTIINWQQKNWLSLVDKTGEELNAARGAPVPTSLEPSKEYDGPPRIIVLTLRSIADSGEALSIKVIFLDRRPPRSLTLHYRPMGRGEFTVVPATHVARGVYRVKLPAPRPEDVAVEYYLHAETRAGKSVVFPPTAPQINQTVVVAVNKFFLAREGKGLQPDPLVAVRKAAAH